MFLWFIEYQTRNRRITKKVTSTFDIPCSIFCGSNKSTYKTNSYYSHGIKYVQKSAPWEGKPGFLRNNPS